jgi:hypothetical protein
MAEPMNTRPAGPLPDDIAGYLLAELPDVLDAEQVFALERLVEYAYATGYAQGHLRGFQTGDRDARRRAAARPDPPAPARVEPIASAS